MSTALMFGFPQKYVVAAKSITAREEQRLAGWEIKYITANGGATGATPKDLPRINEFAEQSDGIHVIGFSDQKGRNEIANQISPFFRFRWFNYNLVRLVSSPNTDAFVDELVKILAEETAWSQLVKPSDLNSPLLLPQCAFKCDTRNSELWRHALAYGDMQNVIGAERAVDAFSTSYHRKVIIQGVGRHKWVDGDNRIFDDSGERHGKAPYPRNWKFSYRIEAGFHYDVIHAHGHRFVVEDFARKRHSVNQGAHLNVDPHGYVR